jgi:CheY-like chemotaxis protein
MKQLDIACIVDDDKIFSYLLSRQMKMVNFCQTTLTFSNGMEALSYLRPVLGSPEMLPSVILLDLNMPVLDGWQFLDEFEGLHPSKKITIYIVSSSIDSADHERALKYNTVSNFYIKPLFKRDLYQMLEDLLPDSENA